MRGARLGLRREGLSDLQPGLSAAKARNGMEPSPHSPDFAALNPGDISLINSHFSRFQWIFCGQNAIFKNMADPVQKTTAIRVRELARQHNVAYARAQHDALADDITRLAGDDVKLDEIEQLLIALQRAGHLTRHEVVRLQASYLREAKS